MDLRVDKPETSAEFATLAPDAPLPWSMQHGASSVYIVDASNRVVAMIGRMPHEDALRIAGMVLVAVNTCGGYAALSSPHVEPAATSRQPKESE